MRIRKLNEEKGKGREEGIGKKKRSECRSKTNETKKIERELNGSGVKSM